MALLQGLWQKKDLKGFYSFKVFFIFQFVFIFIFDCVLKQLYYSHSRFNILSEVFYPLFYLYIITILRKINPKKWLSKILVRFWYADIESRKFNLIFTKPPLQFKFCKVVYLLLSLLNSAITLCTVSICVSLRLDTFIVLSLATPSK